MASLSVSRGAAHLSCSRSKAGARPVAAIRQSRVALHAQFAPKQLCNAVQHQEQQQEQEQQQHSVVVDQPTCSSSSSPPEPAWSLMSTLLAVSPDCHGAAAQATTLALGVALLAALSAAEPASAADGITQHQHSIQPMLDIAEGGEEFWGNVAKYGRYFVTVMLGTGYVMVQPLVAAFKRPVTAVAAIAGIAGTVIVLRLVLNAMLGVQEPFDYVPGSIVPYDN